MKHRPKISRILAVALTALTLAVAAGCASGSGTPGPTGTTAPADSSFPVTVGSLTLAQRPERIVVLSATVTEMLFAIEAGPQVVAVDDYSTHPTTAPKTDLSAFKPNVESIATYRPDLVLVSNDVENLVAQLTALSIPTMLLPYAKTIDDSYQQMSDLGKLTGHRAEADSLVDRIRADLTKMLAEVPTRDKALSYYYELNPSYFSATSNTFIGSLFSSAGLVNIADPAGKDGNDFPQLSAEVIVKSNPDLIFLADTKCCGQSLDTVAKRPGWSEINAVRNRQVVALDDDVASRWGPRVVDLMRVITAAAAESPVG